MKLSTSRMQLLLASSTAYYSVTTTSISAFSLIPPPLSTPQTLALPRSSSTIVFRRPSHSKIYSSTSGEDEDEEEEPISDELAKLIGKRASISSSSSTKTPSAQAPIDEEIDDPTAIDQYDNKSGMDIFDMPDLKFTRAARDDDSEDDGGGSGAAGKDKGQDTDGPIDYQADYDDENEFHVPNRIGFDTRAWGDVDTGFKAGKKLKKKEIRQGKFLVSDLKQTYKKLMKAGITLTATSEHYGLSSRKSSLTSEHIIARCSDKYEPLLASSMANPYNSVRKGTGLRLGRLSIVKAIEGSAERLGVASIDLYQVPTRMGLLPNVVVDALNTALDQGLIQGVGAIDMAKDSMERFSNKLSRRGDGGYVLTSNQFEFSLVNRKKSGLIGACKFMGVVPIASNPLGDGLASGVYTAANPSGGEVAGKQPFDFKTLNKWSALHSALGAVQVKVKKRMDGENQQLNDRRSRYGGKAMNTEFTPTQIAINYVVAKGCVPIPSIKNPKEADELIGCLGWGLTEDEVRMLDNAADMCDQGL